MAEFNTPKFLLNHSPSDIFGTMKLSVPSDIDLSQGNHSYNLTYPTALALAELYEYTLPEFLKLAIPEWSYGEMLDEHAKVRGMSRRSATAATGRLTVTGDAGTVIQEGSLFSTASVNEDPTVDYKALSTVEIPSSGTATVNVQCTQTGLVGNAPAGTVIMVSSRITGIASVINDDAISGGTEDETDESLSARIVEYDKSQGDSFTGCVADYKRWATSVAGVGEATVTPASDNSGTVTIVITDSNGEPATSELCTAVYNYIMAPNAPEERLAPIGAVLVVQAPDEIEVSINATVEISAETTIEAVKEAFLAKLESYLQTAISDGEIKYTRIGSALSATDGVNDYKELRFGCKINGATVIGDKNVPIAANQLPTVAVGDITLIAGAV